MNSESARPESVSPVSPSSNQCPGPREILSAARLGDAALKELLREGTNINVQHTDGSTALHLAIATLIEEDKGWDEYDENQHDKDKEVAEVVARLLANHADPNIPNNSGNTALVLAIEEIAPNTAQALLDGGADPNVLHGVIGQAPIHLAIGYSISEEIPEKVQQSAVAMIKALLATENMDPNFPDDKGRTPLHFCICIEEHDSSAINPVLPFELLLASKDINPNIPDKEGKTPLHRCIGYNSSSIVAMFELLLAREDLNPNIQDKEGRTVLHEVVERRELGYIKQVLGIPGIDPTIKNNQGQTALCALNAYLAQVDRGSVEHVNALKIRDEILMQGANNSCIEQFTYSPLPELHWAASGGNAALVATLLKEPGTNLQERDYEGNTPLHLAARGGQFEVIQLLGKFLTADALNVPNKSGETPLHLAVQEGLGERNIEQVMRRIHAIEALCLLLGYKINVKDNCGATPLHRAVLSGCVERVAFLLQLPATEVDAKDNLDRTALDMAELCGYTEAAAFLRKPKWMQRKTSTVSLSRWLSYVSREAAALLGQGVSSSTGSPSECSQSSSSA